MNRTLLACFASTILFSSCKETQIETLPAEIEKPVERQLAKKTDAPTPPKLSSTEFDVNGASSITIGDLVDTANLTTAFAADEVALQIKSSEGIEIGKMFVINKDAMVIAQANLVEKTDLLRMLEIFGPLTGPEGIRPSISTYKSVAKSLGVKNCIGGAEELAEHVVCDTKHKNMRIVFYSTIKTTEQTLDPAAAAKALGSKKVYSVRISN